MLIPHRTAKAQGEGEREQLQQYNDGSYSTYGHPILVDDFNQFIHAALQCKKRETCITKRAENKREHIALSKCVCVHLFM